MGIAIGIFSEPELTDQVPEYCIYNKMLKCIQKKISTAFICFCHKLNDYDNVLRR